MNDPSNLPRLYDEKEVGKLLKRATELQREDGIRGRAGGGMSLAELEEIGAEAGIDPAFLRRAAAELASGDVDPTLWEQVAGEQMTLVREAVLPGELPPEGFERVVAAIQQSSREHGQPSLLGRTLTWQAETASKARTIQVTVSVRTGETHVRVEERLHQMASGVVVGTTMGGGMGLGMGVGLPLALNALGSALLGVAIPLGTVAVAFIASREIYRQVVRRRRRAVAALTEAVVTAVENAIAEHTL